MTTTIDTIIDAIAGRKTDQLTTLTADRWDDIAVTAIVLGLAPQLHWQLEQREPPPSSLPPMTMAKLAITRQAHTNRNQSIAAQLGEILAACARQNIPVIVLKGALLAPCAYPESGLRPMNDIDLLFKPADLSQVGPLLEGLGYHGKHTAAEQGPGITKHLSTYRRNGNQAATPNPYLSAGGDRTVEPHLSLEESWFGLKVDITPGVWQRAVPVSLGGQPALRLSTTDMLIHLTVHAAFHVIMGASVFVQLYDIGCVLNTWPTEINWSHLLTLTTQAQAQPFVYAGFYWAKTLFDAPVPAGPLAQLKAVCRPRLVTYIHQLDADALFRRTQQPTLTTLSQRLQRGLSDRREAARWAGSWQETWKIWQTALALHKTDTVNLLLGRPLKTANKE